MKKTVSKNEGVPLILEYPEIPVQWLPEDDFSSHRPMLYRTIKNVAHNTFLEFGTGKGSTPLLKDLYANEFPEQEYVSYENDPQWYEIALNDEYTESASGVNSANNHHLIYTENLLSINIWKGSIVFIDCAPAHLRKSLINKHASIAKMIIVHDTEPGAEYVYGLQETLNSFKFRCDLIVEGLPQTTVVSNLYDFENWKTIINDQIKFL